MRATSEPGPGEVVLVAYHVSRAFPGVLALDDVSFEVRAGEVNALSARTVPASLH